MTIEILTLALSLSVMLNSISCLWILKILNNQRARYNNLSVRMARLEWDNYDPRIKNEP